MIQDAKRTAGSRLNEAELFERHPEGQRDETAFLVQPLAGHLNRQHFAVVPRPTRFEIEEGVVRRLRLDHIFHNDIRFAHRLGRIAAAQMFFAEHVAFGVNLWRIRLQRVLDGEHCRQHLVIDFDFLQRLLSDFFILGHDESDGVAEIADFLATKDFLVASNQAVHIRAGNVFVREHSQHAGNLLRFAGVDIANFSMRIGGAQDFREQEFLIEQILTVLCPAGRLVHAIQPLR